MKTVLDLIKQSLYNTGAIAFGEQVDPDLAKMVMLALNAMRAEWSGTYIDNNRYDQNFINLTPRDHITLGNYYDDSMTYSAGTFYNSNGDIVTDTDYLTYSWDIDKQLVKVTGNIAERPSLIEDVVLKFGNINMPLKIKPYSEFRDLPINYITSIPSTAYLDNNYPIQNLYLFPNMSVGQELRVIGYAYFREYENVGDYYMDLPELFNAQVFNLALRICPMLGVAANPQIVINAHSSLKHLKNRNFVSNMGSCKNDFASRVDGFNFWSGL